MAAPYMWVPTQGPPPAAPHGAPPPQPGQYVFVSGPTVQGAPQPPVPPPAPYSMQGVPPAQAFPPQQQVSPPSVLPMAPAPAAVPAGIPASPPQWVYVPAGAHTGAPSVQIPSAPVSAQPQLAQQQAFAVHPPPPPPPPPQVPAPPTVGPPQFAAPAAPMGAGLLPAPMSGPPFSMAPLPGQMPPTQPAVPFMFVQSPSGRSACPPARVVKPPQKEADPTPWLDAETGAVNVRVLLLKSRDIRRKLRAALYHAGRPQHRLNMNERAKASRVADFEARLKMIDEAARSCGMLPPEGLINAHATALNLNIEDGVGEAAVVPDESDATMALWSSEAMRGVFVVVPGAPGVRTAEENFAAALVLMEKGDDESGGAVSAHDDIYAVLYRKFVLSVAHHVTTA